MTISTHIGMFVCVCMCVCVCVCVCMIVECVSAPVVAPTYSTWLIRLSQNRNQGGLNSVCVS